MKELTKTNKIIIILGAIGLLILGAICNDMINRLIKLDEEGHTIKTTTKCAEPSVYISEPERNIYTYCLESIEINDNGKFMEFRDYYLRDNSSLEELTKKMEVKDALNDGGSILYVNEKNDLAILMCNTLEGNKDVYIGPKDMTKEEGFCKTRYSAINTNEFEIVYHITDILPNNDDNYKYVTLYEPNGVEVETVTVKTETLKKVKRNKSYTFKFTSSKIPFESNIKNVFENAELVEIVELKK